MNIPKAPSNVRPLTHVYTFRVGHQEMDTAQLFRDAADVLDREFGADACPLHIEYGNGIDELSADDYREWIDVTVESSDPPESLA